MVGNIAQVISLVTYGNVYLAGAKDLNGYYPKNSTFKSCKTVSFVDLVPEGGKHVEKPYAANPIEWFPLLKADKCKALRIARIKSARTDIGAHKLAGLAEGGDRWLIEAIGAGKSDFWESRWVAGDRKGPDKHKWRVTYGRIASQTDSQPYKAPDPDALRTALRSNLTAIRDFACTKPLGNFVQCFETALGQLDADTPLEGAGYSDIAPEDALTQTAAQLLAAAQAAWVFGGKESWNDLHFEGKDQQRYDALTRELHMLLIASLVYAGNLSGISGAETSRKPLWKFWQKP